MHCKSCHYALWNLATRTCPECGASFTVHDYRFAPGDVNFRCTGCGEANPWPAAIMPLHKCASCGAPNDPEAVALVPLHHRVRGRLIGEINPWLIGLPRAWSDTIGMVFEAPTALMRGTPPGTPLPRSFAFAARSLALFGAVLQVPALLIGGFFSEWLLTYAGGITLAFCALIALLIPLIALTAHIVLRLTTRPAPSIRGTLHALCYCTATASIALFPVLGPPIAVLYAIAVLVPLLAAAHHVSSHRAAVAVTLATALITLPIIVFISVRT